jgi:hypothetical protein
MFDKNLTWHPTWQHICDLMIRHKLKPNQLNLVEPNWGLRTARALQHLCNNIIAASSSRPTLFIARVSICRTQQVWGKYECKGLTRKG